jgi:hypothetical protein
VNQVRAVQGDVFLFSIGHFLRVLAAGWLGASRRSADIWHRARPAVGERAYVLLDTLRTAGVPMSDEVRDLHGPEPADVGENCLIRAQTGRVIARHVWASFSLFAVPRASRFRARRKPAVSSSRRNDESSRPASHWMPFHVDLERCIRKQGSIL